MANLWDLLGDCIPNDHARQVQADYYIKKVMPAFSAEGRRRVLDLGCGRCTSAGHFRRTAPDVDWFGVDIPGSPESSAAAVSQERVVHYDGEALPFADHSFSVVYSRQVFEHVRRPAAVLDEVYRVLETGGVFIGSTSQLEPYHSFSVWNYTPYGFRYLVEAAGMTLEEMRPGIDGVALILRAYHGRPPEHSRYFAEESPLNAEIDEWGRKSRRRPALINLRKLQHCGQFSFLVRRND